MRGANLADANLFGADLMFCKLQHATLDLADLCGTCMAGFNLSDVSMIDGELRHSVLLKPSANGGNLMQVKHNYANAGMEKAIFKRANMTKAKVSDAVIVQTEHGRLHSA